MFKSVLQIGNDQLVESRKVALIINYSFFPVNRVPALYYCLIQLLASIGISDDNFVLKGYYGDGRGFYIEGDKLKQVIEKNWPAGLIIEGFSKSEVAFDKNSYRKRIKDLNLVNTLEIEVCSADYEEYFKRAFFNVKDEHEIMQSVKDILNCPQTASVARKPLFDFTLLNLFNLHKNNPSECYGRIRAEIPILILGQETEQKANQFKKVLLELKSVFNNITGSIAIETKACNDGSTYMNYFGGRPLPQFLQSVDIPLREFAQTKYIEGVEWFNLISPAQAEQLANRINGEDGYSIVNLADGGQIIQSTKALLETDINIIRQIKRYLYPVLFPGEGRYRLSDVLTDKMNFTKPRRYWELAPVLDNEVIVENGYLIYRYNRDNLD